MNMEFLLNLSKETLNVIIGITGGAICTLHIGCALVGGTLARVGQYLNVFLHVLLFSLLMLSGAAIDVALLFFMASVALYTSAHYVKYQIEKGRGKITNDGGDAP